MSAQNFKALAEQITLSCELISESLKAISGESALSAAQSLQTTLVKSVGLLGAEITRFETEIKSNAVALVASMLAGGEVTLDALVKAAGLELVPTSVYLTKASPAVAQVIEQTKPIEKEVAKTAGGLDPSLQEPIKPSQKLIAPYKTPLKYYDPATGCGWSGRGPVPTWFKALLDSGRSRESLLLTSKPETEVVKALAPAPVTDVEPVANQNTSPVQAPVVEAQSAAVATDAIGDALETEGQFDASVFDFDPVVATKVVKVDPEMAEFLNDFATRPYAQILAKQD